MVMARLHTICGNCGCADNFDLYIMRDHDDVIPEDEKEDAVHLLCNNCSTIHDLKNNAQDTMFDR